MSRAYLPTASLVVLFAFFLRIFRIGAQELWIDEAYSYLLAAQPDWFGLPTLANNTPPLYHFVLRVWMSLLGEDETAIRLVSAIFGTLLVAAVIWTGREIFSPSVGLWSGCFAAIAPFHIFYSQEARSYALLALALTLTYGTLARAIRVNTPISWGLVTASAGLALYSHYFAVLGLLPTVLFLWALPQSPSGRPPWNRYLIAMGTAAAIFLPWGLAAYHLAPHPLEDPSFDWLRINWLTMPPALAIPKSFEMLGLGGHSDLVLTHVKQFRNLDFPFWARLLGLIILSGLFVYAMLPWGDERLGISRLVRRKVCVLALLLFPLGALWVASRLVTPMYIVGRYDIIAFPAYSLLVGLSLAKIHKVPRRGVWLVGALVLLLSASIFTKLYLYYQAPAPSAGLHNARILDRVLRNGDVVVFTDPAVHVYLYYLARLGYTWHSGECRKQGADRWFYCRFFPPAAEATLHGISGTRLSVQDTRAELEKILASIRTDAATVWIISGPTRTEEADAILFGQLTRLGFEPIREMSEPPFFAFQRAAPPPEAARQK